MNNYNNCIHLLMYIIVIIIHHEAPFGGKYSDREKLSIQMRRQRR